jgi:ABC-2 type transport system ATP-binding protein
MIEIKNLNFRYEKKDFIFETFNIEFKPGNIYGLLGENGVGKTTLLRLISGLLFPNNGGISVLGHSPKKRETSFLENIYYLPEVFNAPLFSLDKYVDIYSPFYPKFKKEQFCYYANAFGVDATKKIAKMSYGQQKKAFLSFALACNTSIILLDEPTNGLDIPSKTILRKLIAETSNNDKCIIISTHQVRDLENLIDPIVIIEYNQILLNNTIEEITNKLWFGVKSERDPNTYYYEDALGGYSVVEANTNNKESKVNIEMLFNAVVSNKNLFKKMFINNKK